jgi:hypothetical protein
LFTSAFNEKCCFDIYAFFGGRLLVKNIAEYLREVKVVLTIELIRHIEKQQSISSSRKMKLPYMIDFYKIRRQKSNERKTKGKKI